MKFTGSLSYILLLAVPSVLSAALIEKRAGKVDARDPVSLDSPAEDTSLVVRGDGETPKLYPRVDVGLPKDQWVTVPIDCASCIIACMTTNTAFKYVAGQTISTIDMWRAIGVCAVNCVFQDKCTSKQGGTWQAQQPHDFPLDS